MFMCLHLAVCNAYTKLLNESLKLEFFLKIDALFYALFVAMHRVVCFYFDFLLNMQWNYYMHRNGGVYNNTEWADSSPLPCVVDNVAPDKSRLECKICRLTPVYIALCHACIINVHSTLARMSKACIHLGVHDHN